MKNCMLQPAKNCKNCKHLTETDLSFFSYNVLAKCGFGIWEQEFLGDGDYSKNMTNIQVCDNFEYSQKAVKDLEY